MGSQKHCLRQAKECDRLAAEAKLKSDREVLRLAAAMCRTLAAAYELFKGDAIIKFGELSRDLDKAKPRKAMTPVCPTLGRRRRRHWPRPASAPPAPTSLSRPPSPPPH